MRTALLLALSVLALHTAFAEDCAWNPDVLPGEEAPATGEGVPTIADGDCFEVSPLSVVWLESDGCECVMDSRIVGRFRHCDPECDIYLFGYSIGAAATGDGSSLMGESLSGESTPTNPPPIVFFDDTMKVECGSVAAFRFSVSCECYVEEDVEIQLAAHTPSGAPVPVSTVTVTQILPVCWGSQTLCEFSAVCDQECSASSPPPPIPVGDDD